MITKNNVLFLGFCNINFNSRGMRFFWTKLKLRAIDSSSLVVLCAPKCFQSFPGKKTQYTLKISLTRLQGNLSHRLSLTYGKWVSRQFWMVWREEAKCYMTFLSRTLLMPTLLIRILLSKKLPLSPFLYNNNANVEGSVFVDAFVERLRRLAQRTVFAPLNGAKIGWADFLPDTLCYDKAWITYLQL